MSEISLAELSQRRETYYWAYGGGALLTLISIVLWWTVTSVNPQRVFLGMLSQSLATSGVTMQINESNSSTTIDQRMQYSLGASNKVHASTTLKEGNTTILTEMVGDRSTTYTRYVSVKTDTSKGAKAPSMSGVLGVWAKAEIAGSSATTPNTQLLSQAALGISLPLGAVPVPIGNLSGDQRAKLLQQIRQQAVYQTNYAVTKSHQNGHLLYAYKVTVQPVLYLSVMKTFATDVGLHDLDQVQLDDYSGASPISMTLTVDAHSRQLVKVDAGSGYQESYSGYGIVANPTLPKNAISSAELQSRLSALQ